MLVRLTDSVHVAPEEIAAVEVVDSGYGRLLVRLKGGESYSVGNDYGKSIWETQTRLLAEINAARPAAS